MSKIVGTGFYVPKHIVYNSEISTSPEWVAETLGIKERRYISTTYSGNQGLIYYDESIVDLCVKAAQATKFNPDDIDVLIVATATPEKIAPSTACMVAKELGLNIPAFDINAVCSGFVYGLTIADSLILAGARGVLLIGADVFSTITDFDNRNCVFFGDGAGAVVLKGGINFKSFFWSTSHTKQGFTCDLHDTFEMDGKIVYNTALELVPIAINQALKLAGMKIEDIDYMVPHQPSLKILLDIADKVGMNKDKVLMNMGCYANTSAATIPILLAENWHKFKEGHKIMFASIGSGWTYGAIIYEV